MCCLYCGKEIGAFRLLRDSEFCTVAHRKKYGERLSKTLHDIAAPEPPPAGIAGFRELMPLQNGNRESVLRGFQRYHLKDFQIPRLWRLRIDVSDPRVQAAAPAIDRNEPRGIPPQPDIPPMLEQWMRAPAAQPVEALLAYTASVAPLQAASMPRFAAGLVSAPVIDRVRNHPALCEISMPASAAEPVTAYVRSSSHLAVVVTARSLRFQGLAPAANIVRTAAVPVFVTGHLTPPAPEAVAAFVRCSAGTELLEVAHSAQFPALTAAIEPCPLFDERTVPSACDAWMPSPAPEAVAAFVQSAAATEFIAVAHAAQLPLLTAGIEPCRLFDERAVPSACDAWMPSPAPEAVAAFVQSATATEFIAIAHAAQLPLLSAAIEPCRLFDERTVPASCESWMPAAEPEAVAAFVQSATATEFIAIAHAAQLPLLTAGIEPCPLFDERTVPASCESWMPSPAPEAVAAFVQSATATEFIAIAHAAHLPRFTAGIALHESWIPAPAPEAVAAFLDTAAALPTEAIALRLPAPSPAREPQHAAAHDPIASPLPGIAPAFAPGELKIAALAPAALHPSQPAGATFAPTAPTLAASLPVPTPATQLPAPQFTAHLEPLPALDDLLEPPAFHEAFLTAAAPEPVWSYLRAASAPHAEAPLEIALPTALHLLAALYVPRVRNSQVAPFAEAVMAKVVPIAATAPVSLLRQVAVALPESTLRAANGHFEESLTATPGARAEAVEALLGAAHSAIPVSIRRTPRTAGVLAGPRLLAPAPTAGEFFTGPQPAALEALLVTAVAEPLPMARSLRVLPLLLPAGLENSLPLVAAQELAPAIAPPAPALPCHQEPRAVATVLVAEPAPAGNTLYAHIPRHELAPLEFHPGRFRGEPVGRPEWISTRVALLPPRFNLRAALDKLEDPVVQPKPVRKTPELLNMPAAKRQPTVLMVAGRVAAAFLLASSLWYGVNNYRGGRRAASEDLASSGPAIARNVPSDSASSAAPGAPAEAPKGAVAWVRQAIAERASVKVAENFSSMDSWVGSEKSKAAGWRRHPDGYMNTGALALFSPTLKFKNYRMEFFGQIEQKSLGWTVRASDTSNYHAMKLSVIEAGTRPFVALVQYNVVGGKAGRTTSTPLNIMVHNNRPMQFAIDVKGNKFVTSIDGEEVDSFVDNTLTAGGVGFFSDAGERARLYWLRVARNDDWLGHVCAMLADTVSTTADLRAPGRPAVPLPGLPANGDDSSLLSAAWLGLPYLTASRRTRLTKSLRSDPWNS